MKLNLKPTSQKIIFSLIIIFIFIPFINYNNGVKCMTADFVINPFCSSESIGSPFIYLLQKFPPINEINILVLIGGGIVSYLIASLLISSEIISFRKN